jgi:hypothetical protein
MNAPSINLMPPFLRTLSCLSLLTLVSSARAQEVEAPVPFYRVYEYETPLQDWAEAALWNSYIPSSDLDYEHFGEELRREDLWAHSLEAEYGLTDQFSLAGYLDFEDPQDAPLRTIRGRVEARYRIGQRYDYFINTALYAEYIVPRHDYSDTQELETRLILDKDFEDFRVILNPIVEIGTTGEGQGDVDLGFAGGVYYRRFYLAQPGLELFSQFGRADDIASWHEQQQILFGTVELHFLPGLDWQLGVGGGLTDASDNLTVKSILRYEFDVSRLF